MDGRKPAPDPGINSLVLRRSLMALLLGTIAFLCLLVLRPFLSPVLWAAILAYATWPAFARFRRALGNRATTAAALMTLLAVAVAIVPLFALLVLLQHELADAYRSVTAYLGHGPHTLAGPVREIPWFGDWLQGSLDRYDADPAALGRELSESLGDWNGQLAAVLGGAGRNLGRFLVTVLTLFFFYRDGDTIVRQIRRVAIRFFEDRLDRYVRAAGMMTRAVLYGLLITAVAQGLVAGLGYWIFGLETPVVLGALTGLLSTAPLLGTAFIWVPVAVALILAGHFWKGVLMLAWGVLLVHPIDNVLRPYLISNVTRAPFLLVMFGALGGLAAFGLIGVFIGPVILGVANAIWREWVLEEG